MESSNINPPMYNLSSEQSNLNTTDQTPVYHPRPIYVFILWFIFGIIGNCTAVVILIRNSRKHKWTIFYKLVFMLAVSDFSGQMLTIPIMFVTYSNRNFLVTGGHLCNFMSTITIMTSLISVLLVCLMAIDRVTATWCPIFYRNKTNPTHLYMYVAVVLVVTMALVVGLLPISGVNTHILQIEGTWCFVDLQPMETRGRAFLYLCASIGLVAVLSMLLMNGLVLVRLCHKYTYKERPQSRISTINYNKKSGVRKVQNICFLITIMIVFMTSWIPVIIRFYTNASGIAMTDFEKDKEAVAMAVAHQVLNPWIYIIMQECLFSRTLKYARKHSKQGSIFHRILADDST